MCVFMCFILLQAKVPFSHTLYLVAGNDKGRHTRELALPKFVELKQRKVEICFTLIAFSIIVIFPN